MECLSIETRTYRKKVTANPITTNMNNQTTRNRDLEISMMPDLSENLPTEKQTYEELKKLRSLPLSMTEKREMRKRLQNTTYIRLKGCKKCRWSVQRNFHTLFVKLKSFFGRLFDFWQRSIDEIERSQGIVLGNYFMFLKSLLVLNAFLFLPILLFLIIPNTLFDNRLDTNGSECDKCCSNNRTTTISREKFHVIDLLTAKGSLTNSFVFYGFYHDIEFFRIHFGTYIFIFSTPIILISILIKNYLLTIVFSMKFILKFCKKHLIERDNIYYRYSTKIFASWNLSLTNERLIDLKKEYIFKNLQTVITRRKSCVNLTSSLICNLFFLLIIVMEAIFYYYFFSNYYVINSDDVLIDFLPPIIVTILNDFLPYVISKIEPEISSVTLLLYSTTIRLVPLSVFLLLITNQTDRCAVICWETFVGVFFYRLTLIHVIYQIFGLIVIDLPRKLFLQYWNLSILGGIRIEIGQLLLDLFYVQILCWIGIFFIPVLSGLLIPILFLLFYIKRTSCFFNFPSKIHFSHEVSHLCHLIVILLTISLLFSLSFISYYILLVPTSQNCGPMTKYSTIWGYVEYYFETLPLWLQGFLSFFLTSKFFLSLIVIFSVLLFYFKVVHFSNRQTIESLKQQLFVEGQDKQFLLDRLNSMVRKQDLLRKRVAKKSQTELKVSDREMMSAST